MNLAKELSQLYKVIIVGLDISIGDEFKSLESDKIINLIGKTNLVEVMEIIASSEGVVSNDSAREVPVELVAPEIQRLSVGDDVDYFSPTNERWLDNCTVTVTDEDGNEVWTTDDPKIEKTEFYDPDATPAPCIDSDCKDIHKNTLTIDENESIAETVLKFFKSMSIFMYSLLMESV